MLNYSEIAQEGKILATELKGTTLRVYFDTFAKDFSYKYKAVAQEVQRRLNYLKGIK